MNWADIKIKPDQIHQGTYVYTTTSRGSPIVGRIIRFKKFRKEVIVSYRGFKLHRSVEWLQEQHRLATPLEVVLYYGSSK